MKSYCKGLTIDEDFVREAYSRWRVNEAGRRNEWRVYYEHGNPDNLIAEVATEIRERRLGFAPVSVSEKSDGVKVRNIGIESVKMQLCGYVVDTAIQPLMDAKLGYWQISRPGMGQFKGARAASRWLKSCKYHIHMDVRKCYDTLSCEVVMGVLEKYVKSPDVLYTARSVLSNYPGGHVMIGSYISMRLAMLVMSFGYHKVENIGRGRRGKFQPYVKHLLMYADDVWLYGTCKRDLKAAARDLEGYMARDFGLTFKPWKVRRNCEPSDVAGAVAHPGYVTIRAKTFRKARRSIFRSRAAPANLNQARRLVSYNGWMTNCDCKQFATRAGVPLALRSAKRLIAATDRKAA